MDRQTWVEIFARVLRDLRPQLSISWAIELGRRCCVGRGELDPVDAAHIYHLAQLDERPFWGTMPKTEPPRHP